MNDKAQKHIAFFGGEALDRVIAMRPTRVLDVGSGRGVHAAAMRRAGLVVTTCDSHASADIPGGFCAVPEAVGTFDCIWCCHTLEHMTNIGTALRKMARIVGYGGIVAITVPPMKSNLVGGHLTLWTPGLLVYNLVRAGLDCSGARVGVYGYNISVIVTVKWHGVTDFICDHGELEQLQQYFPWPVYQGQHVFETVNWRRTGEKCTEWARRRAGYDPGNPDGAAAFAAESATTRGGTR